MGEILGFPPKAIKIFNSDDYNMSDRIPVVFCGMYFMSYKQALEDDMKWLFNNRKIPVRHDFKIKAKFLDKGLLLQYDADKYYDKLDEILEDIKRKLE